MLNKKSNKNIHSLPTFLISTVVLLTFLVTKVNAQVATDEGDVLLKVQEKVEAIRKNPKALIGSVTDKTQDSIQIKNLSGSIDPISITDATTFTKIASTSTDISFTDIALGDYVVAMGHHNTNNILESQQILLVTPIEEPKRKVLFGTIKAITRKDIKLSETETDEKTINLPKSWKGPDTKELEVSESVLVVALEESTGLTLRTIQKITSE